MKSINRSLAFVLLLSTLIFSPSFAQKKDYYEIKVFHIKDKNQENLVDNYLQKAVLPALHQKGIQPVGVFKPYEKDTVLFGKRIYVLIPYKKIEQIETTRNLLATLNSTDPMVNTYLDAQQSNPAFQRVETILLSAFSKHPRMKVPQMTSPKTGRIYELRSYESASEKLHRNKVHMFNEGDEVGLFNRLKFNAVFYGEVLAGAKMPNLMYMTCFDNFDHRNAQWKIFSTDSQWSELKARPEYKQPNVSKNEQIYMHPTEYSDY